MIKRSKSLQGLEADENFTQHGETTEIKIDQTKSTITVGELRNLIADLPDDAPIGVDYDALALTNGLKTCLISAWGAYVSENALVIVRN